MRAACSGKANYMFGVPRVWRSEAVGYSLWRINLAVQSYCAAVVPRRRSTLRGHLTLYMHSLAPKHKESQDSLVW